MLSSWLPILEFLCQGHLTDLKKRVHHFHDFLLYNFYDESLAGQIYNKNTIEYNNFARQESFDGAGG